MLVLSRKTGETILIGEDIEVTVVRVSSGAVRIGISAPQEYRVLRQEIREADAAALSEESRGSAERRQSRSARRPLRSSQPA